MTIASDIRKKIDSVEYNLLPKRYFTNKVYVLLYHCVSPKKHYLLENMSESIFIAIDKFTEQIEFLSQRYKIVSMEKYISGNVTEEAVIITFDDGFKDIYTYAYPILKEKNIPFSICINSNFINNNNLFWLSKINYLKKHGLFNAFLKKHGIKKKITKFSNNLDINNMLDIFFTENQLNLREISKSSDLYLSENEIRQMPPELLTILPHTHQHYKTVDLTYAQRKEEIEKSITYCKEEFSEYYQPVFSFPFGSPSITFDGIDIDILKENQIEYFLSAENGINNLNKRIPEIKRKSVYSSQSIRTFKYFTEKPQIVSQRLKSLMNLNH